MTCIKCSHVEYSLVTAYLNATGNLVLNFKYMFSGDLKSVCIDFETVCFPVIPAQ